MFKMALNRCLTSPFIRVVIFTILISCMMRYLHPPRAEAYAVPPQLTISLPAGGTQVTGHVGTKVHLSGSGFAPGTFQLYTTTSNDPTQCTSASTTGTPVSANLAPFTPTTATAQNDGILTVDTTWPSNASIAGTAYYICAIASFATSSTSQVLSANAFTVAPPPTITASPTTLAAGQQVTITGANWLPPQTVTVAVTFSNVAAVVVSDHALPDHNGNLTATLTIPATTPAGNYALSVIADNETTLRIIENNALTVTTVAAATPTASITPTVTATASPAATTTPTPTPSVISATDTPTPPTQGGATPGDNTSNTNGTSTFLIFLLGGLGILLVIVGIILFILYSRNR